mgnify:CR=1 FL=1
MPDWFQTPGRLYVAATLLPLLVSSVFAGTLVDIVGRKRSQSRPGFGVVNAAWRTYNQHGELVMSLENAMWVAVRGPAQPDEEPSI